MKFGEIWLLTVSIIVVYFAKESFSKTTKTSKNTKGGRSLKIDSPVTIDLEIESKFDVVDGSYNELLEFMQNSNMFISKTPKEYLKTLEGNYFYGSIFLGTPPQKVYVVFDTGSSDLVVTSISLCRDNKLYCKKHKTYNHNVSQTYHPNGKPFKISYGRGSGTGFVSQDNVAVAGLIAYNQSFAELTVVSDDLAGLKFDGILGMAFPAISQIPTDPPFVTLVKQNVLPLPMFSFYLSTGPILKSSITLGGLDKTRFTGDITYTPVVDPRFWTIIIDKIVVGTTQVSGKLVAIPDTGSSLMLGPPNLANAINSVIGGISRAGYNFVDCYTAAGLPSVTIYVNGQPFVMDPVDYVKRTKIGENNYCRTAFVGSPSLRPLIIGDVFIQRYYTVFDYGNMKVGFAPSKQPTHFKKI